MLFRSATWNLRRRSAGGWGSKKEEEEWEERQTIFQDNVRIQQKVRKCSGSHDCEVVIQTKKVYVT